jgi:hypothetical protein
MPKLVKLKGGNLMSAEINNSPNAYNQDYMNQVYPNNVGIKDNIYVDTQTSFGWYNQNDVGKMYSVDINAGYNDYMFSRTTPDNKFITTTGLELHKGLNSFELVGGKKKVNSKKELNKESKKEDFKEKLKDSFFKTCEKIKKSGKKLTNYIKSKTFTKKEIKPKPKSKTSPKKDSSSKIKTSSKKETSTKSKTSPKKDTTKPKFKNDTTKSKKDTKK